jgi:phasin family protein
MVQCTKRETIQMKVNETYEMMIAAANDTYANMRKLAELNLATWDKLVAKQMEMMTLCLDASSKQYDAVKNVKGPDELVGNQVAMARECGEKLMEKNREMVDLLVSTREDYQGWVEESVQQVKDQLTKSGATVSKPARKAA